MTTSIACIAGEEIHRQWQAGRMSGQHLGPRDTPFGKSGDIYLVESEEHPYYLLSRHGEGLDKTAPFKVNYRANIYALKDLGINCVIGWGPGGAITHNIAIGDLVILNDVIDRTYLRPETFFEDSPLGFLRQFPVFCTDLRRETGEALHDLKLIYHGAGTAAVSEGPRLETPAEIRVLTNVGAEIVTHNFVPEVFLARELEMCYTAICYVVNYAETGSRHRPFIAGGLFGGLTDKSDNEKIAGTVGAMSRIISSIAGAIADKPRTCDCTKTMQGNIHEYGLSEDWKTWFK